MDIEKQKILVMALAYDPKLFSTCNNIVKTSYFDPSIRKTVSFLKDFYEKYKTLPENRILSAETGFKIDEGFSLSKAESSYVEDAITEFCRNKAIEASIIAAPSLLEKQDFAKIEESFKNAISISLNKDLGTDYFSDPEGRLNSMMDESNFIHTGWDEVDNIIGGVGRQELLLFGANSGKGKSIVMLNLARNLILRGFNGIYFTLEMSENTVAKRLDSMLTSISQNDIFKNIHQVSSTLGTIKTDKIGKFHIKRFPETVTNVNDFRAYIKEYIEINGFKPDFIVVDYLDLMASTRSVSQENLFVKDKFVAEEVRSLGFEFDCLMISASQLGRGALETENINQGHIQGGISKVNTCDNFIAIVQSDAMRAAGEYVFEFAKTRNSGGVGRKVVLGWDPISLRVYNLPPKHSKLDLNVKNKRVSTLPSGGTVLSKNNSKESLLNLFTLDDSKNRRQE
jgi:archaellum biogenesis ATPase FlaH